MAFYDWKDVQQEDVVQLLAAVKKLFADPANWIFWPIAVNATGQEISPHSPTAAKWSLLGAGERCARLLFTEPLDRYIECAMRDYLNDISDGKLIHGLPYDEEYDLLCIGYEFLCQQTIEDEGGDDEH